MNILDRIKGWLTKPKPVMPVLPGKDVDLSDKDNRIDALHKFRVHVPTDKEIGKKKILKKPKRVTNYRLDQPVMDISHSKLLQAILYYEAVRMERLKNMKPIYQIPCKTALLPNFKALMAGQYFDPVGPSPMGMEDGHADNTNA